MAEAASKGSSVEGEKLLLVTRKFYPYPQRRCAITKKWRYPFSLSIFGSAEIEQAYDIPGNQALFVTSMVGIGDKIHGTTVTGWALKTLREPNVTKATHTHSANVLSVKGGCFAEVETPPREHAESKEIAERHPPVIQIPYVRE